MTGFSGYEAQTVELASRQFSIRRATAEDVPDLVKLLRDDVLGAGRESAEGEVSGQADAEHSELGQEAAGHTRISEDLVEYKRAFALIDDDPNQLLMSVEETSAAVSAIVGTLQLSLIPSLSRRGSTRLQIEAVRVGQAAQGLGLGTVVLEWAHDCGRRFGATMAQLTTDKSRSDAQRFYGRLGYVASHEGLKRSLE